MFGSRGIGLILGFALLLGAPRALACVDADGDGVCVEADCDDANPDCGLVCSDTDGDEVCDDLDNCALVPNPGQGPLIKLNAPIPPGGSAPSFAVSRDGVNVVYRADAETPGTIELFTVPARGGASTKLNSPLPPGVDVESFAIALDGSGVAYVAKADVPGVGELYGSPIGESSATKLSVPGGSTVGPYAAAADGRVVFHQKVSGEDRLYSTPISGGSPVQLSHVTPEAPIAPTFVMSPDATRAVYRGGAFIRSVPVTGGPSVALTSGMTPGGDAKEFLVTPDSTRVIYRADAQALNVEELFIAPIDGGASTKLNAPLASGADVTSSFAVSPDSAWVYYQVLVPGGNKLFLVPSTGGAAVEFLSSPSTGPVSFGFSPDSSRSVIVPSNGAFSMPIAGGAMVALPITPSFQVSADSSTVVWRPYELYSVPITGGTLTLLSVPDPGKIAMVSAFALSADGSQAIYVASGQGTVGVSELYRVPVLGGSPTRISPALVAGGDVADDFVLTPDSRVIFRADAEAATKKEIYAAPATPGGVDWDADGMGEACDCDEHNALCGLDCTDSDADGLCADYDCDDAMSFCRLDCVDTDGDSVCNELDTCVAVPNPRTLPVTLNGPLVSEGDVSYSATTGGLPLFSPDGATVLYAADAEIDERAQLYSVAADGGPLTKLNGSVPFVSAFALAPNGSTVVFSSTTNGLFSVPIHGGPLVMLSGPLAPGGGSVDAFAISPDGSTVVYRGDSDVVDRQELYRVPIGGGAATKLIGAAFPAFADATTFAISPNSSRVLFLADLNTDTKLELFSAPLGGGSAIKLSGPIVANGKVFSFVVDAASLRVVYLATAQSSTIEELFSAPIAGGAAPVTLNGPLPVGGDVLEFQVTPDATRVVYRGDAATNDRYELFSVPIGGGSPVKLNPPLGTYGNVAAGVVLAPDGSRVLFLANIETNQMIELYSVPVAGGPPIKLNGPMISTGDVNAMAVSRDSATVFYRAGQDVNGVDELYRVPIDGGPVVKVNGPIGGPGVGAGVGSFAPNPDDSNVLYLAQQDTATAAVELYHAPLLGTGDTKVSDVQAPSGGTVWFGVSTDGSRVLWVADEDVYRVFELHSAIIAGAGEDADGDGLGGACDCSSTNGLVWALPGDIGSLALLPDKETLRWELPTPSGAQPAALTYDTLRSTQASDFEAALCVELHGTDLQTTDPETPAAPGQVFYYLIRPQDACGAGSVGPPVPTCDP